MSAAAAAPAVIEVDVGAGTGAKPAVAQRLEVNTQTHQQTAYQDRSNSMPASREE
jgi:hypothetical protein